MTNELSPDVKLSKFSELEGILTAQDFAKQGKEGMPLARKAMEDLYKQMGLSDLSSGLAKTVADERVVGIAINNVADEYNKHKEELTIGQLANHYDSDLSNFLGDSLVKAKKELDEHKNETYGNIMKTMRNAKRTIDGAKDGQFTEEEAKKSEKNMLKYQKVILMINSFEQAREDAYSSKIQEKYMQEQLQGMYKDTSE